VSARSGARLVVGGIVVVAVVAASVRLAVAILPRDDSGTPPEAAAVWTGTEVLIWGGSVDGDPRADGAAWTP
jgi:hypothetical protein